MKKLLFTAGTVAVLALASCSNDETLQQLDPTQKTDPNLISYNAVTSNSTRAASLYHSGSAMPDFWVWTRFFATKDNNGGTAYFKGDKIEVETDDQTGKAISCTDVTADRYWPTSPLDFFAYSQKNEYNTTISEVFDAGSAYGEHASDTEKAAAHDASLTVKNVSLDNDAAKQCDMLYSVALDQNKLVSTNITDDEGLPNTVQVENQVTMNFRHAFAQLAFQFQNINSGIQVKVDQIRLVNIKTKGDVKIFYDTKDQYVSEEHDGTEAGLPDYYSAADNQSSNKRCYWDQSLLDDLNEVKKSTVNSEIEVPYRQTLTGADGAKISRVNWAYAKMATNTPIELNNGEKPEMLYGEITDALSALTTARELVDANISLANMTTADADYDADKSAAAIAALDGISYVKKETTEEGKVVYSIDETKYAQAVKEAKVTDAQATYAQNQKFNSTSVDNAMFVIPQAIVPGNVPSTAKYLKDVTGMYFLIKCSIRNIADASLGAQESDEYYLYGNPTTTKFVLVPVRETSYELDGNSESGYSEKYGESESGTQEQWLTEWEPGKKYVYTIIFGAKGSNGGIPTIDPTELPEGQTVDPDPDDPDAPKIDPQDPNSPTIDPNNPDNPTPIDPNSPTLTVINYNVQAFTIDCWENGKDTNVNVTVDKDELTTTTE